MKKILIMMSLILASIAFTLKINAYSPIGTQEIQAYSNNTSIAYAENPLTNWYRFTITYIQPYSARYVLFSSTTSTSTIFTRSADLSLTNVMYNEHTQMNKEWYFYLGTVTTYYAWVYNPVSGALAQSSLQTRINSELYYYYDITNTAQSDVIDGFVQRYYTLDNSASFNAGYSDGLTIGYNQGVLDGTQDTLDWYVYFDETSQEYKDWTYSYNQGLSAGQDLDLNVIPATIGDGLQSILNLNFAGITLGGLVMIPLMFSIFLWFIKFTKGGGK